LKFLCQKVNVFVKFHLWALSRASSSSPCPRPLI